MGVDELVAWCRQRGVPVDAGAHLSLLCEAGISPYLPGYWVREKGKLPLQEAVRRLTSMPAETYRIPNRGRLNPGYQADVVVFDPQVIATKPVQRVYDLPAGEPRFIERCEGVSHSLVNGVPVLQGGEIVEAEPEARGGRSCANSPPEIRMREWAAMADGL